MKLLRRLSLKGRRELRTYHHERLGEVTTISERSGIVRVSCFAGPITEPMPAADRQVSQRKPKGRAERA